MWWRADPYLTAGYQSAIAGAFVDFLDKGYVYKGLKPVNWCITHRTALAESAGGSTVASDAGRQNVGGNRWGCFARGQFLSESYVPEPRQLRPAAATTACTRWC